MPVNGLQTSGICEAACGWTVVCCGLLTNLPFAPALRSESQRHPIHLVVFAPCARSSVWQFLEVAYLLIFFKGQGTDVTQSTWVGSGPSSGAAGAVGRIRIAPLSALLWHPHLWLRAVCKVENAPSTTLSNSQLLSSGHGCMAKGAPRPGLWGASSLGFSAAGASLGARFVHVFDLPAQRC